MTSPPTISPLTIALQRLPHLGDLPLPVYATPGAAGMDLRAALAPGEQVGLEPGARLAAPTGLAIALPAGFEAQVRPRSGLALKHGITCLNTPGTIDSDYRGEIFVILINLGAELFPIARGDRIAQLVIAPVTTAVWVEMTDLPPSDRGAGGFGSTGRT